MVYRQDTKAILSMQQISVIIQFKNFVFMFFVVSVLV